jgi:hypothetical protein
MIAPIFRGGNSTGVVVGGVVAGRVVVGGVVVGVDGQPIAIKLRAKTNTNGISINFLFTYSLHL